MLQTLSLAFVTLRARHLRMANRTYAVNSFGAGAMGGTIRYTFNKPNTEEFSGVSRPDMVEYYSDLNEDIKSNF